MERDWDRDVRERERRERDAERGAGGASALFGNKRDNMGVG